MSAVPMHGHAEELQGLAGLYDPSSASLDTDRFSPLYDQGIGYPASNVRKTTMYLPVIQPDCFNIPAYLNDMRADSDGVFWRGIA